jgi:hypothetical protein
MIVNIVKPREGISCAELRFERQRWRMDFVKPREGIRAVAGGQRWRMDFVKPREGIRAVAGHDNPSARIVNKGNISNK